MAISAEQKQKIHDLRAQGLKHKEIAKAVGCSSGSVSIILRGGWAALQTPEGREASRLKSAKRYHENKEEVLAQQRDYAKRNQAKISQSKKDYHRRNYGVNEHYTQSRARYKAEKAEELREYYRLRASRLRSESVEFRIKDRIQKRHRLALVKAGGERQARTCELFGMDWVEWLLTQPEELVEIFVDPERTTEVHVDEIRPCSSFDLTDPAQQACCFNWRNRQLLSAFDNVSKKDNWDRAEWEAMMIAKDWAGSLF